MLVPNFSISQSLDASKITFTDTSTGTDASVTDRRIFLQKVDGTYLVPFGVLTSYIDFPLSAGATQTTQVLSIDYSLNITINWVSITGATLYTKTQLYTFDQFAKNFAYYLLQLQAASPSLANVDNFWQTCMRLYVDIFNAESALTQGADQFSSQTALNDSNYLVANQNVFF